jgi:hypothetical protein
MDGNLGHRRAASAGQRGGRGVRHRIEAGTGPRGRNQLGSTARRPAWSIDLVRMVQFDDLGRLEEAGRLRREPHHEDRADAEVWVR